MLPHRIEADSGAIHNAESKLNQSHAGDVSVGRLAKRATLGMALRI